MKTSDMLKRFVIAVEHEGAKMAQEISWRRMKGKDETSTTEEVWAVTTSLEKIINDKRVEAIEKEHEKERRNTLMAHVGKAKTP